MLRVNLLRAHGSTHKYNSGCHCTLCKKANSERANYQEAKLKSRTAASKRFREIHHTPEDLDKRASYQRVWAERNSAKVKAARDKWRKANPEKCRASIVAAKARRSNAPGVYTDEDIFSQYARQNGECFWGKSVNKKCSVDLCSGYHIEHVTPLSLGGSNFPSNIVLSCPSCNWKKNKKHPMDWAGVLF